jgi:hypothetical protein
MDDPGSRLRPPLPHALFTPTLSDRDPPTPTQHNKWAQSHNGCAQGSPGRTTVGCGGNGTPDPDILG